MLAPASEVASEKPRPDEIKDLIDVGPIADHQLAVDKERTKRFPDLLARKMMRMSGSPLAFLRGAAPLFYEILAARPDIADGPPGEGWIVGDLHLENFGAYRPETLPDAENDPSLKKRPALFNLNDFDDTVIGPWRLDVLRLATSLLLGGRELGANGCVALELCDHLLESWSHAAFDGAKPPEPPAPVAKLIEQVRSRPRPALLGARTETHHGKRRFVRGPRYADLPKEVLAEVPKAFEDYIESVTEDDRPHKGSLEIIDAALRIAGTGSLGGLRIAVLVEGKGGKSGSGAWIFDLKEQGTPSAAPLKNKVSWDHAKPPAQRVCTGYRACIEHPPRAIGTAKLGKVSLFGRRLSPQEDKLDLKGLRGSDLPDLAKYLGSLLGTAHARGSTSKSKVSTWSKSDREAVRTHAIMLAGIHESVYLALCDRMRPLLKQM